MIIPKKSNIFPGPPSGAESGNGSAGELWMLDAVLCGPAPRRRRKGESGTRVDGERTSLTSDGTKPSVSQQLERASVCVCVCNVRLSFLSDSPFFRLSHSRTHTLSLSLSHPAKSRRARARHRVFRKLTGRPSSLISSALPPRDGWLSLPSRDKLQPCCCEEQETLLFWLGCLGWRVGLGGGWGDPQEARTGGRVGRLRCTYITYITYLPP